MGTSKPTMAGRLNRYLLALILNVRLLRISYVDLVAGSTEKIVTTDTANGQASNLLLDEKLDQTATEKRYISLHVNSSCTTNTVWAKTAIKGDGHIQLTFLIPENHNVVHASETCKVRLTSRPSYVIWAVLLEHSPCGGGVIVLLWDKEGRRQWDVCSAWHAPGPDFTTSSNKADVSVELSDVTDHCNFTISVRAVDQIQTGQLELMYLSSTEGTSLLFT